MCKDLLYQIFPCLKPKPLSPYKGLAMATVNFTDYNRLNMSRFYFWSWSNDYIEMYPYYIPMARNGYIFDNYKGDPAYCLFLNEPNGKEPQGSTMSPEGALVRFLDAVKKKPYTQFVVGNVSHEDPLFFGYDGITWLEEFLGRYENETGEEFNHIIGVHCYGKSVKYMLDQFKRYRQAFPAHRLWLTEFALIQEDGVNPNDWLKVLTAAAQTFEAYFVYTNRQIPGNPANIHPCVDMFNLDGTIRPHGIVTAEFLAD